MRSDKPLLGFGPAGWALLAVAASLLVVLITGYDLRFQVLHLVQYMYGDRAMYDFVIYIIIFHGFNSCQAPPGIEFGLISLCGLLIAMQVDPRPMGVVRWLLACALGVGIPPLIPYAHKVAQGTPFLAGGAGLSWAEVHAVVSLLASLSLAWIMRSWIVLGGAAVLFTTSAIIGTGQFSGSGWANSMGVELLMWLWNPLLFALLMFVAVRARLRLWPEYACQTCGYDLRGITAGVCPECGEAVRATARGDSSGHDAQQEPGA